MITVKDLVERLETFDQDMPVYWGVDELPCWITKEKATIKDFPMQIDYYMQQTKQVYFLYFADYEDLRRERAEYAELKWNKSRNILVRIKDYIFGWDM